MIVVLLAMILYSLIHSWLAGQYVKNQFKHHFGERTYFGLYRLLFNAFALISIIPIMLLVIFYPGSDVWELDLRWEPLLLIIQAIGMIGLVISLLQIDLFRFIGLRQLRAYLIGEMLPLPDEKLQTKGIYSWVRHPLYLFSILLIWPVTTMTETYFGFCLGATLYFIIGSFYEERRMIAGYGQEYTDYQQQVPWILPIPRFRNKF